MIMSAQDAPGPYGFASSPLLPVAPGGGDLAQVALAAHPAAGEAQAGLTLDRARDLAVGETLFVEADHQRRAFGGPARDEGGSRPLSFHVTHAPRALLVARQSARI